MTVRTLTSSSTLFSKRINLDSYYSSIKSPQIAEALCEAFCEADKYWSAKPGRWKRQAFGDESLNSKHRCLAGSGGIKSSCRLGTNNKTALAREDPKRHDRYASLDYINPLRHANRLLHPHPDQIINQSVSAITFTLLQSAHLQVGLSHHCRKHVNLQPSRLQHPRYSPRRPEPAVRPRFLSILCEPLFPRTLVTILY